MCIVATDILGIQVKALDRLFQTGLKEELAD